MVFLKIKKIVLLYTFLIFLLPSVFGSSIVLLAANLEGEGGSIAYGNLEIKEGNNRIFIENNLLSKEDTQLSVRLAKEFICSNYGNCKNKDFLYTIDSASYTISGPSGGAAFSLLTFAALHELKIPINIGITGTINSGGYIGNVGGLKDKVITASKNEIDIVIIPKGNRYITGLYNASNATELDLIDFGKSLGVKVIEVGSFDEILHIVYGIERKKHEFIVPDFYIQIMTEISNSICGETRYLIENLNLSENHFDNFLSLYHFNESNLNTSNKTYVDIQTFNFFSNKTIHKNVALDFYNRSQIAKNKGDYYSSSSFCFSANLKLRYIEFLNFDINKSFQKVSDIIDYARSYQINDVKNLNDVQIYAIVEERLRDAEKSFIDAEKNYLEANYFQTVDLLSYSYERALTAVSWSKFFDAVESNKIKSSDLFKGCSLSLNEAKNRINYLKIYYPLPVTADETLSFAENSYRNNDFVMCIFYSLKAKAEADSIVSVIGASEKNLKYIVDVKEEIAKNFVGRQYAKGQYPVLSYSYIEYASSLRNSSLYSALVYLQMAQEFSNLDLYFEVDAYQIFDFSQYGQRSYSSIFTKNEIFLLGFCFGIFFTLLTIHVFKKRDHLILEKRKSKEIKPLRTLKRVQHPRGKKR